MTFIRILVISHELTAEFMAVYQKVFLLQIKESLEFQTLFKLHQFLFYKLTIMFLVEQIWPFFEEECDRILIEKIWSNKELFHIFRRLVNTYTFGNNFKLLKQSLL
jgi:hypothetical protein